MNLAMQILNSLLGETTAAPVAPPKPTTTPTRPAPKSPPRPGTRPWSPSRRPGVAPKPKARHDDRDEKSFAESEGSMPVPPPPSQDDSGPEPTALPGAPTLVDQIKPGDRVTIITRHGSRLTGRAVMKNRERGCWVLNLGGAHGTPGLADEENIVQVKRAGRLIYGSRT